MSKAFWRVFKILAKSEKLAKAPMPYFPSKIEQGEFDPAKKIKEDKRVSLPGGYTYVRNMDNMDGGGNFNYGRAWDHHHHLVNPEGQVVAEVRTKKAVVGDEEDSPIAHTIKWSQVHPDHKGKNYGKKLMGAIVIHGTDGKPLASDTNVSVHAQKAWQSFFKAPGFGGRLSPYTTNDEKIGQDYDKYQGQHILFVRNKDKAAQHVFGQHEPAQAEAPKKLAASELEKAQPVDWNQYGMMHSTDEHGIHHVLIHKKHAYGGGDLVGEFQFVGDHPANPNMLTPMLSEVDPEHRRKGLASAAYQYAEKTFGKKIGRSPSQTLDAKKLWNQPGRSFGSELEKGVKSPSKHIPLARLQQIKQDNYRGEGGKDYSAEEVHTQMTARMQSDMDRAGKQKETVESDKNRADYSWMFTRNSPLGIKGFKK